MNPSAPHPLQVSFDRFTTDLQKFIQEEVSRQLNKQGGPKRATGLAVKAPLPKQKNSSPRNNAPQRQRPAAPTSNPTKRSDLPKVPSLSEFRQIKASPYGPRASGQDPLPNLPEAVVETSQPQISDNKSGNRQSPMWSILSKVRQRK